MIFYSSGWKEEDIRDLCQYAQQVQRNKRKIVNYREKELVRLSDLAVKLEKVLMGKLENKPHLD